MLFTENYLFQIVCTINVQPCLNNNQNYILYYHCHSPKQFTIQKRKQPQIRESYDLRNVPKEDK